MSDNYVLCLQTTPAMKFAADNLARNGIAVQSTPTSDTKHLLLPVPSFMGGSRYLTPILAQLPRDIIVSGGNLEHPALIGYRTIDFLQDPYYLASNAAITAKCALQLIDPQWKNSTVLILGWGRIGKCLGKLLAQYGAKVTIAARKESDLALIQALGYNSIPIQYLNNTPLSYQVVFNTVPEMILPNPILSSDTIVIELASSPGICAANVINGRGLPGKYAPEESGKLIADTFIRLSRCKEE